MSEDMTKGEFLEKLANPNKEKVLKAMEHFIEQYGTMVAHVTYVSFDRGVHNILLVTRQTLVETILNKFMIQMNMAIPNAEVRKVVTLEDSDTNHDSHIVQINE